MHWQNLVGLNAGSAPYFILLLVWSLIWKGLALWRAARLQSKPWFIVMLILNTAGILEILYLYLFSKRPAAAAKAAV
ncbi:MAG TPA: DUF5652 family protein [Patescibacteria group bacterium]|nr:DUF5652 family protein [Patescibacteria group bacterium]